MGRAQGMEHGPGEIRYQARGFWALVVTQFQGAFNDNVYQWLIIFSLIASMGAGLDGGHVDLSWIREGWSMDPYDYVTGLSGILFSLPFIIFPSMFGALADRVSKGRLATATKVLEVAIMIAGGLAFVYGNIYIIWFLLFMMATQSAMFGPAKYGIMPEILPESRLSWGNGIIQMGTLAAVILGTLAGGKLHGMYEDRLYIVSMFLVLLSMSGVLSSLWITRPPAANPGLAIPMNPLLPWKGMGRYFRVIWSDRILLNVVIGYVYFWFAGSLVRNNLIKFGGDTLGLSEALQTGLIGAVTIGIGIGAVAAGYLSRGKIEMGLVPIGAMGMALFAGLLAVPAVDFAYLSQGTEGAGAYYYFVAMSSFGLGFFAGMFDVPLAAAIQHRSPKGTVGGVIATTNMLTFVGMAGSNAMFMGLGTVGLSTYQVFLFTALLSLAIGVYISIRLPHLFLRAGLWILSSTLIRFRVAGRHNLPDDGPVLLVGTPISVIDCLAFYASTDREVYFVMGSAATGTGWLGRLARKLNVVLVPRSATEREQAEVASKIRALLASGATVCINREQRAEADGLPFAWARDYHGLVEGTGAVVVPFYMSRLWQSLYIFVDNKLKWRRPKQLPFPIDIRYGEAYQDVPTVAEVQDTIRRLGREVHTTRPLRFPLLHHGFVKMARRNLRKMAVADALTGQLSYFKTLVGSIVFARKLRRVLDEREMVGVLLPPSVGGVLANLSLMMLGKVAVNLNYTANNEVIASCASQCGITQVLTSKKLLERLPLDVPGETIFMEDIKASVSGKDRLIAMVLGLCCPVRLLDKLLGAKPRTPDDLATVIFSSGSEGAPKGVMLTHRNFIANIDGALEIFPHDRNCCIVGFLPFFHSFGFMATLWLPLINGLRGIYHANPLEPKVIGKLTEEHRGTLMIGTSTFMQGFIRRCEPEQLASLEFVVCGAEKLAPRVRTAFLERFGVEPLEGYGTTECAPAVAANIPDCASPGFFSPGTKHGSIGRAIPGLEVKVVDPDSGEARPLETDGLLLVKGPNIMRGYLHNPDKTNEVLRDGWYTTGDIAHLDADGFIHITDRLARFSKIAGEMVPHTKVEETLHELLSLSEQRMAVASVPDAQKGERLVVLHTLVDEELDQLLKALAKSGMPNLWAPKPSAFFCIAEIPVLGTGKMDIKTIKRLALELDHGDG